jgi:hypothetical protein
MRKSFFFPKAWEFYRDGTFTGFARRVQEPCRCFHDCRAAAHAPDGAKLRQMPVRRSFISPLRQDVFKSVLFRRKNSDIRNLGQQCCLIYLRNVCWFDV